MVLGASQVRHSSLTDPLSTVSFVPGLSQGLQKDAAPIGARTKEQNSPVGMEVWFLVFGVWCLVFS